MRSLENVERPLIYEKLPQKERIESAKAALERIGMGNRMHRIGRRHEHTFAHARLRCGTHA